MTAIKPVQECWDALREYQEETPGLRTLPVKEYNGREIRAGILFPDRTETLLLGFQECFPQELPQGHGFCVRKVDAHSIDTSKNWLAIIRHTRGDKAIFATMAEDLCTVLETRRISTALFLERIRAWQEFMASGKTPAMSRQTETGLFGEIIILKKLMERLGDRKAILGWKGPDGGLQDFRFDDFTLEVKTCSSSKGFPVTIDNLEQLDESLAPAPLYLAGVRLLPAENGLSLSELIDELSEKLLPDPDLMQRFERLLIRGGYISVPAKKLREFTIGEILIYPVTSNLPHFCRSTVPDTFLQVSYTIDLEKTALSSVSLSDVIKGCNHE